MQEHRRSLLLGSLGLALATQTRAAPAESAAAPGSAAPVDLNLPIWPALERFNLWPQEPPGQLAEAPNYQQTMGGPRGLRQWRVAGVATPEIAVYRASKPNGSAILVCPGGGYAFLSVQNEGMNVARRFTPFGCTVFVLSYRLPNEGWRNQARVPLQDAQRAMRLLKSKAATYGVEPSKIGVMGFSAGGHLAADLATAFDEVCYGAQDAADNQSARPAFAALIYPVASLREGLGHAGSRNNLLGPQAGPELIAKHSPAEQVKPDSPPCFVMHAIDDKVVPVEASLAMIAGCRQAHVGVEAHLYASGGHGFGFNAAAESPAAQWPNQFETWMRAQV